MKPVVTKDKIFVGISSCLLGEEVRYDGGHKRDAYITNTLGHYFQFVPVCPEIAVGLGVPRETIRLTRNRDESQPRARGTKSPSLDPTDALADYGRQMAQNLDYISGYILKKGSPSCGMERVKVYNEKGFPAEKGRGIFAQELMNQNPLLPVEEEGRLGDPGLRENFLQRVFVFHRWQILCAEGLTSAKLIDFHTRHKLILLAHDQEAYRELGRSVADASAKNLKTLASGYIERVMITLKKPATNKKHANVMMHLMGFLKDKIDSEDKAELLETIDDYRQGQVPLIVPITLLKHHFRKHPHPYIRNQLYMDPHPQELRLRNQI